MFDERMFLTTYSLRYIPNNATICYKETGELLNKKELEIVLSSAFDNHVEESKRKHIDETSLLFAKKFLNNFLKDFEVA